MAILGKARGRLFGKYVVYFAILVTVTLLASGLSGMYFSYRENVAALVELQREKATAAAYKIEQYLKEIEHQIGWTALPQVSPGITALDQRRLDYFKLLRQVPAITEIAYLDASGKEKLRVSRLAMDVIGSDKDFSQEPQFSEAKAGKTWFSPVYFRKETEPYMTLAAAAGRDDAGVVPLEEIEGYFAQCGHLRIHAPIIALIKYDTNTTPPAALRTLHLTSRTESLLL